MSQCQWRARKIESGFFASLCVAPEQNSIKLNRLAFDIDAPLEVIPINYYEYMKKETISPILDQIFKTGIVLF
jgi:hypothetical protein